MGNGFFGGSQLVKITINDYKFVSPLPKFKKYHRGGDKIYQDRKKVQNISEHFSLNRKCSFLEKSKRLIKLKLRRLRRPESSWNLQGKGSLAEVLCKGEETFSGAAYKLQRGALRFVTQPPTGKEFGFGVFGFIFDDTAAREL